MRNNNKKIVYINGDCLYMLFLFKTKDIIYQNKLKSIKENYITLKDVDNIRKNKINYKYLIKQIIVLNLKELKAIFILLNIKCFCLKYNKNYYQLKLNENKELFDNVLGYPLDLEQRKAIINNEWNTLVLAGAGSGKTLTMIGKVLYLLSQGIKESEILVISFTNASVNSFINKIKRYNVDIDVFTFHKLSLKIIKNKDIKVRISKDSLLGDIFCKHSINSEDKKVIISFIHLFKSQNLLSSQFEIYLKKTINNKAKHELIKIIRNIYIEYNNYLIQKDLIDFDDMINLAFKLVDNKSFVTKYKYILVDEYQDTSLIKFNLLKKILDISNSKLIAVGDDWQSIYRFTGCELKIFLDFKNILPYSNIISINNTYRNSQELIDIASRFITKNPYQLKKNIKSAKMLNNPVNIVLYTEFNQALVYSINQINNKFPKGEVLILGRNNSDILLLDKSIFKINDNNIIYKNITIKFMTAHKSKGLEANNVIIINLENKINGFPSKIINHEILSLISNDKEDFIFDEERRLFYVALTRTKNYVYLLSPNKNPSLFVQELISYKNVNITKL